MSIHHGFDRYPTKKFLNGLEKSTKQLVQIANGSGSNLEEEYQKMRVAMWQFIRQENTTLSLSTLREKKLALLVLRNEKYKVGQESRDCLSLLWQSKKWMMFFDLIQLNISIGAESLCKRLLRLYYQHYLFFWNNKYDSDGQGRSEAEKLTCFFKVLRYCADRAPGKQTSVQAVKQYPQLILDDNKHLSLLDSDEPMEDLQKRFGWEDGDNIVAFVQLRRLLQEVKTWSANEYNARIQMTLEEVLRYKDAHINSGRTLLEEVVREMLVKCKSINQIRARWENFIILNVGDPRNSRALSAWRRIGEEYRKWLYSHLSRGDLREFLENLTSAGGDEIFKYRRKFWLQYIDYLVYAKIMLGENDYLKLQRENPEFARRFDEHPETYGRMKDSDKSCIYMQIRNLHIIEGTFSAKVRFYAEIPINLSHRDYKYADFYSAQTKRKARLIDEYVHNASDSYHWQHILIKDINRLTGISMSLQDVML